MKIFPGGCRKALFLALILDVFNCGTVAYSQWRTYTNAQYDSLRRRWSQQDIKSIVDFLNHNARLSMKSIYTWDSASGTVSYDFRGIVISDSIKPVVDLRNSHFEGADLAYLDCRGQNLEGIQFTDAVLRSANFEKSILKNASLAGCDLRKSCLRAANLRQSFLKYVDLRGADLDSAILSSTGIDHARLDSAKFRHADLTEADLSSSICNNADLQGSRLHSARVVGTELWNANLQGVDFSNANLTKAYLSDAKLQDADFFGSQFDSTTIAFANLDDAKIRYIIWGDGIQKRYNIGDEIDLEKVSSGEKKELIQQIVEDTYRDLENIYRKEGKRVVADAFHFRLNEIITASYPYWNPLKILRFVFLRISYGYGTQPMNLAFWSLGLVLLFMVIFAAITSTKSKSGIYVVKTLRNGIRREYLLRNRGHLLFFDCFYFSLLSFSTFGYGAIQPKQWLEFFNFKPVEYKPVGWARICVGIEASLGIYTFALLVTTALSGN